MLAVAHQGQTLGPGLAVADGRCSPLRVLATRSIPATRTSGRSGRINPGSRVDADGSHPVEELVDHARSVPFYVIEFDKNGVCTSPVALAHIAEASKTKTDVFLFSHGWNNDWQAATEGYERFVDRFIDVRRARREPPKASPVQLFEVRLGSQASSTANVRRTVKMNGSRELVSFGVCCTNLARK